jgi:D-amino-acid oxidase
MDWARHRISTLGGTFEQRKVDSLDSIDCDLLINCTGLSMVLGIIQYQR